jgi:hypothetical protein
MRRVVGSLALMATVGTSMGFAVPAIAGTSGGGGRFEGNKYGNENKKDTFECTDQYILITTGTYPASAFGGSAYDLNENGWVCYKWPGTADSPTFVDDISGH